MRHWKPRQRRHHVAHGASRGVGTLSASLEPRRGRHRAEDSAASEIPDLMAPLTGLKPLLVDGRSPTAAAVGQMTSPAARASSDAQILILTPVGGGYRR